jgi:hypothetical protein
MLQQEWIPAFAGMTPWGLLGVPRYHSGEKPGPILRYQDGSRLKAEMTPGMGGIPAKTQSLQLSNFPRVRRLAIILI